MFANIAKVKSTVTNANLRENQLSKKTLPLHFVTEVELMKNSFLLVFFVGLGILCVPGCGGHKGGAIEVTEDNPYQLSPEEESNRAAKISGTKDMKKDATGQ